MAIYEITSLDISWNWWYIIYYVVVPRRVVNNKCGSDWQDPSTSNIQMTEYVDSNAVNFYRIHPNYFFGEGSREIKIKSSGSEPLTICYSRSNIQPRANQSSSNLGDVTCKTITGQEYSISLTDACQDKTFIHDCLPLYFSIEAPKSNDASAVGSLCSGYFNNILSSLSVVC